MSAVATTVIAEALRKSIADLTLFQDVRVVPLNRFRSRDLFAELPDLKAPAALICFRGFADDRDGNLISRQKRWSILIVAADAAGKAGESGVDLLDKLLDADLWDTEIVADQALLRADVDVDIMLEETGGWFVAEIRAITIEELNQA